MRRIAEKQTQFIKISTITELVKDEYSKIIPQIDNKPELGGYDQ